jgi:hypothetical protein
MATNQMYTIKSGTCIPGNWASVAIFKEVQKGANRFLDASGKKLLVCDGKLGKNTLTAVNSVAQMYPTSGVLGETASSCKQIASNALAYVGALKTKADQHNLAVPACPRGVIQRITNPMPVEQPDGTVAYASPMSASVGGLPLWMLAVAGLGGLYYLKKTKRI